MAELRKARRPQDTSFLTATQAVTSVTAVPSLNCGRALHRRGRVLPEFRLKQADDRLADPRERALCPRDRANPVHDLTTLRIDARDRLAVRPVRAIEYSGAVQRPEPEVTNQHGSRERSRKRSMLAFDARRSRNMLATYQHANGSPWGRHRLFLDARRSSACATVIVCMRHYAAPH